MTDAFVAVGADVRVTVLLLSPSSSVASTRQIAPVVLSLSSTVASTYPSDRACALQRVSALGTQGRGVVSFTRMPCIANEHVTLRAMRFLLNPPAASVASIACLLLRPSICPVAITS